MAVNDLVGLYTTLFGWQFYDVIWNILAATGIIFIPIIAVIFSEIMAARSSGSLFKNSAEATLSRIEVRLFTILLVLILAVIPTGATTLTEGTLNYNGDGPTTTDSLFDTTYGSSPLVSSAAIEVPAWWYFTMAVSQGITKSVVNSAADDVYFRDLQTAVNTAAIRDPETRYNLQLFSQECHTVARSKFFADNGDRTIVEDDNIHWLGSFYFRVTPGYYDTIRPQRVIAGYPYNPEVMTEYAGDPGTGGRPTCAQFWNDISADILQQAEDDGISTKWFKVFPKSAQELANVVQTYVQREHLDPVQSADQINSIRDGDMNMLQKTFATVGNYISVAGLAKMVFVLRSTVSAVVYGLSFIQAYALMALYLMIPVALLASGYSLTFLVSGALLIFSVIFWSALWSIAAAADNFMSNLLWDANFSSFLVNLTDPENLMKDLIHSVTVLGLYTIMPIFSTWMIMASGSAAARAIGASAGVSTGASNAATSSVSSASRSGGSLNRNFGRGGSAGSSSRR